MKRKILKKKLNKENTNILYGQSVSTKGVQTRSEPEKPTNLPDFSPN